VSILGDARYVGLRVHDLDVGLQLYVGGGHHAGPVLRYFELYRLLPLELELQLLHIEDDVHHVLLDAGNRGELMTNTFYTDFRDRGPREPGEHHAPQGITQGMP
jgi:hypothetical protein